METGMQDVSSIVGWLWAAFVLCWLVLAQFNKKASSSGSWRPAWALRLAVLVGVLIIVLPRRAGVAGLFAPVGRALPLHVDIAGQWVGVGLCVVGFGFAVWARLHIGRNWGMPMSLRQDHELVTSGPYA
jgi:protein-S-isoprenylcysteine O-methyltransferase Ste14